MLEPIGGVLKAEADTPNGWLEVENKAPLV